MLKLHLPDLSDFMLLLLLWFVFTLLVIVACRLRQ